jgi:hypothetical protein
MKDGQTIGQWLNWDFKTNGSLEVLDKNSNLIYFENSWGWDRHEYDSEEKLMYYENSDGFWVKHEYDSEKRLIYHEYSDGRWLKREYDSEGHRIYYEDSFGSIIDNRTPKIIEHNGRKYQLIP